MKSCTHHWKINRDGSAYCTRCLQNKTYELFPKPDRLLEGKREIAKNNREMNDLFIVLGGKKPWMT